MRRRGKQPLRRSWTGPFPLKVTRHLLTFISQNESCDVATRGEKKQDFTSSGIFVCRPPHRRSGENTFLRCAFGNEMKYEVGAVGAGIFAEIPEDTDDDYLPNRRTGKFPLTEDHRLPDTIVSDRSRSTDLQPF